jgi:uncharacterized protein (DUF1501 family)
LPKSTIACLELCPAEAFLDHPIRKQIQRSAAFLMIVRTISKEYQDDEYRKARPKLSLGKDDVIELSDDLGLHPAMKGLMPVLESQAFSMVHGVGYPSPNRSHFESMDIWHTCQRKDNRVASGWLGRIMENGLVSDGDAAAYHLGGEPLPMALVGRGVHRYLRVAR